MHSRRALAALALTASTLVTALSLSAGAGAQARTAARVAVGAPPVAADIRNVVADFDGGDQWRFCHDFAKYTGDMDYAVGDPPRAKWAAWVARFDACWGKKHLVHIRYNHEINGDWMPWSYKTPAQFKKDFADFKAYVKKHSRHARSVDFGLALNFGTHRFTTDDYWTPAADYVAVSAYEAPYLSNWAFFDSQVIGPTWWLKWSKAHNRRLAFGEWGALDIQWQGQLRRWGARNHVYYGAYLYDPKTWPYIPYTRTPVTS